MKTLTKIAVINQKGGVGKSTISVNMAYGLAQLPQRTLLIDLDPQAHSCDIFRGEDPIERTVKDLFIDPRNDIKQFIYQQEGGCLHLIYSNILLAKASEQISSRIHREKILYNHLRRLMGYEFIIMDCPPNLGVITINAIYAADFILIPVNYDKGALDGMADLLDTIQEVKEGSPYTYRIIRNMFDSRNKQTNYYIDTQLAGFSDRTLNTKIRKTESLNQSRIAGTSIFSYDPESHGAIDYRELIKEINAYV